MSTENWLRPDDLMIANRFWHLIATLLREPGQLHMLIVTRSDTAAGCSCVRFVGEAQTRTRTLRRVDIDHLRPLLASIAPDTANPVVVSNPANGWHELRERLEADLQRGGAILMQQVQTVLLGLRALPVLSPRVYAAAGGIPGVEGLFIARALRRAADAAGGGEAGRKQARGTVSAMVLRGAVNQAPKAQRALHR